MKYTASWNNKFPDTKKYSKHKCVTTCQGSVEGIPYYLGQTTWPIKPLLTQEFIIINTIPQLQISHLFVKIKWFKVTFPNQIIENSTSLFIEILWVY